MKSSAHVWFSTGGAVSGSDDGFFDAHPDVPLVADTGDSLFATVEIRVNDTLAPAYYATMGFAVPTALGLQVASGRRPLALVGDGAFQMTGTELSRAAELGCAPIVVLLSNGSWEMLESFVPGSSYNEVTTWPYAKMAALWGHDGVEARTMSELRRALDRAWDSGRSTLIEVQIARGDISPVLSQFVTAFKRRVSAGGGR